MVGIADIPVEVFIDNIFPAIDIPDLLALACANRYFGNLVSDETFWKRKLQTDYNFNGDDTARASGWKLIYRGLRNPKLFLWGENSEGRLALSELGGGKSVPSPTRVRIPGKRIVSLVAGGTSFHALDTAGAVYVWGKLKGPPGSFTLKSDGFSKSQKMAPRPLRLQLPSPVRSISCGRWNSMVLDDEMRVWNFNNWGRPFQLISHLLDGATYETSAAQIECGWSFSSALTKSGDVLVWWPTSGTLGERVAERERAMNEDNANKAEAIGGAIPCIPWTMEYDPVRLDALPKLPQLRGESLEDPKVVKIAAMSSAILAMTNKGHVLRHAVAESRATGGWEYLPEFSDAASLEASIDEAPNDEEKPDAPRPFQISHISANWRTFTAYSTGTNCVVLMGDEDTRPGSLPKIIPSLQNKSVISVVLGDYHFGALTSTGKLLTWGAYSNGALGLGDPASLPLGTPGGFADVTRLARAREGIMRQSPPDVDEPTEVRFDHGLKESKDMFCFTVAASGWHTGALVADMEPEKEDDDPEQEDGSSTSANMPGSFPNPTLPSQTPHQLPGIPPYVGTGIFRVGYAGRGRGADHTGPGHP